MSGPGGSADEDSFTSSREHFDTVVSFLDGEKSFGLEHGDLEEHLEEASRELFRRLFQDHLSLRAQREQRLDTVVDASGIPHGSVEEGQWPGPGVRPLRCPGAIGRQQGHRDAPRGSS
jgi:hypothetical protein